MTAGNSIIDEPVLIVSRPPRFWGSPFGWAFVAAMCLVVIGGLLVALDEFRQPADPVVVVKGIMASKEDFFEDGKVKDLLRERGFEVEITSRGSREIAIEVINQGVEQYDFAFPSGQPAADMIKNHGAVPADDQPLQQPDRARHLSRVRGHPGQRGHRHRTEHCRPALLHTRPREVHPGR